MEERTLSTNRIYEGRILSLDLMNVEMENGVKADREIVRHCGAVAVLARLPDGRFAMVRQFRKPLDQHMLEVVAGILEPGENPDYAARRELKEETGYDACSLERVGGIYPSPGYTDEHIEVFFAELNGDADPSDLDHDEHVELVLLSRSEIERKIQEEEIKDGKTLAAWLLCRKLL